MELIINCYILYLLSLITIIQSFFFKDEDLEIKGIVMINLISIKVIIEVNIVVNISI